ncbi:M14 family metallopeptidase [uncultured Mailhella sp.]|uniref:M14 family metallopeptidase n=1 Tax=uncultured Mailhella sp. TaxID=1981031 RepID=UPI0025EB7FAB|nr:M14 family metallopeptidase [uncultured Mailhella sp.]
MIKTVISTELPVDEHLLIRKNSISSGSGKKRICIVTGTHGDELEGQYICYRIGSILQEHPECLDGTVEIYPALNPLGIDSITRGIPSFDLDMNRIFPGDPMGSMAENTAYNIIEDLKGADLVLDIHSSNIFLYEVPQVRINQLTADRLVPLARYLNLDFLWVHEAATVLEATLAYSLNALNTPTLVVEMGVGMRITMSYGDQLVGGILNLMRHLGVWTGDVPEPPAGHRTILSTKGTVEFINASASGVFIPLIRQSNEVEAGQSIGRIVDPLRGVVLQEVAVDRPGFVFTIRAYPVVYEGSLLARVYREDKA